jgi:ferredoxin
MTVRIEIVEGRCVGAGQCALTAPAVFDQDDDEGLVLVLDASPPAHEHDAVREAASVCPTGAISIVEEG